MAKEDSTPATPLRKRMAKDYSRPEFRPYAIAIGETALAWNDLQETLAALFWTVLDYSPQAPSDVSYPLSLAAWYTVRSDRAQRNMLAAVARQIKPKNRWNRAKLPSDLAWLLGKAENLEDDRNNAIHSPLLLRVKTNHLRTVILREPLVMPATNLGHPRANQLSKEADVLQAFNACRDWAIALADFGHLIDCALMEPQRPWPNKPVKQTPPAKTSSSRPSPPVHPKRPQPPPRSSRP